MKSPLVDKIMLLLVVDAHGHYNYRQVNGAYLVKFKTVQLKIE